MYRWRIHVKMSILALLLSMAALPAHAQTKISVMIQQAKSGDFVSQMLLAGKYYQGEGTARDKQQALHWWRQAASYEHTHNIMVAIQSKKIFLTDKHRLALVQSVKWLERQKLDDAGIKRLLGLAYLQGIMGVFDYEKGFAFAEIAARQGDAQAQVLIGNRNDFRYYRADGKHDPLLSLYWYERAAEQGNIYGYTQLGFHYHDFDSLRSHPQNAQRGVMWRKKAAEQGYAGGQLALGTAFALGVGVDKDAAQALHWHELAAEQGDEGAQRIVAYAYYYGTGTEPDKVKSYIWFRWVARKWKHKDFIKIIKEIEEEMSAEEYIIAEQALSDKLLRFIYRDDAQRDENLFYLGDKLRRFADNYQGYDHVK